MELKEVVTKWTAERDGCEVEIKDDCGGKNPFNFQVRMRSPHRFICGNSETKEAALSTCNAIIDHWISL